MFSRLWKRVLAILGVILLLVGVAVGGYHLYLYSQGKTVAYQIPYLSTIIRLGKVPKSSFPKSLDASFTFGVEKGQVVRVPKYVDDMIVDNWDDGALQAHDIRTGAQKLYYWTDDTTYNCMDPNLFQLKTDDPNLQQSDFKTQLANFHWYFSDDGWRGEQLLTGITHMGMDVSPGDPIKLFLKNRAPDADGAYHLVGIFLFISKPACATGDL